MQLQTDLFNGLQPSDLQTSMYFSMEIQILEKLRSEFVSSVILCEHPQGDPHCSESCQLDHIYYWMLSDNELQMRTAQPACLKNKNSCNECGLDIGT